MLYSSCYRAVNITLLYRAIDLRQSRREVGKERGESPFHPLFIFSNLMSTLWTNLYVGECVCVCQEFGVNKFLEFLCAPISLSQQQQTINNRTTTTAATTK